MDDKSYQLRISGGRRVVLPPVVCDELDVDVGDTLVLRLENGHAKIQSVATMVDRFRGKLREKIGIDRSLVDELIAERSAEAAHE